jgi:hypothetical protein
MRNEEFEIVRDLISGRGDEWSAAPYPARSIAPASFREIDGYELARQYVAHRQFRESERLAQQEGAEDPGVDRIRLDIAFDGRRPDTAMEFQAYRSEETGGWLSSLARLFGLR